jgi:DNA polymerase-1
MEPWTNDVHSETTHNALMQLGYENLEKYKHYKPLAETPKRNLVFGSELNEKAFKLARYKGKTFNFMKNYGGGAALAMEVLDIPRVAADALVSGYETAFPEVITYQRWVVDMHNKDGYVENHTAGVITWTTTTMHTN